MKNISDLWDWPTDLTLSALKDLGSYPHKESVYTAAVFAFMVWSMTRNAVLAVASLVFFIRNKIGMLGTIGVLSSTYGYATRNMVVTVVGIGVLYYAAGGRL